jgi:hypothetical protein
MDFPFLSSAGCKILSVSGMPVEGKVSLLFGPYAPVRTLGVIRPKLCRRLSLHFEGVQIRLNECKDQAARN